VISSNAAASSYKAEALLESLLDSVDLGDFRITLVRAGSYWWDGGAMFGVVPKTLWSKHQPADDLNRIEAAFNCYVVEDGNSRILIDLHTCLRFWQTTVSIRNPSTSL
jgi:hypothetical protein